LSDASSRLDQYTHTNYTFTSIGSDVAPFAFGLIDPSRSLFACLGKAHQ